MTQLATQALHVQERDGAVRSLCRRGVTWVSLNPIPNLACGADIATRQMSGFGIQSGKVWGNRHEHTHNDVRDGNDDFSVHINLSGHSIATGRRGEIDLHDGDAVLLTYSEPRSINRPKLVRHLIVRLPRASLSPLVRNIDDAVMRPIRRGTGALSLLANYAGALIDDQSIETSEMQRLVVNQLCDLIAITLGATRDSVAVAEGRGIRAARLQAVKADIEAHIAHSHLSQRSVARRRGISDSYIRKLFASEGTSFSHFVLTRRLARAHRMLTDRQWADRNITWIAFEAGFGDLSYFNRTFKRFYGAPPSEIREQLVATSLEPRLRK